MAGGASAIFTKIAEVDNANTAKKSARYEKSEDRMMCTPVQLFKILNKAQYIVHHIRENIILIKQLFLVFYNISSKEGKAQ